MGTMQTLLPGLTAIQNIHPMFVHFPIAFLLGAMAMEGVAVFHHERFHPIATCMLYMGTLAAMVTLSTGFIAANTIAVMDSRGHSSPGHDYIHIHRNWMIAVTLLSVFLSLYLFWINRKEKWTSQRGRLLLGLMILSVLVTLGADRGARLVFEFGAGVSPKIIKEAVQGAEHGRGH